MADDQTFHDHIEGYCTPLSGRPGETVELHVSTVAATYDVVVERWGASRDVVWRAAGCHGEYLPAPPDADARGCRWPAALRIPIGDDWRSGFHLVTLTAHGAPAGKEVAHACFVVRPRSNDGRSRALWVLETNTWNAYNTWGGRSLYTGGSEVSFERPFGRGMLWRPALVAGGDGDERDDRKARPVRFGEEPDVDGTIFQRYRTDHAYPSAIGSTGWFTHGRRFAEWAESAGYELDYAISADLELDPKALEGYGAVLSVGHDEYWSAGQRDALEAHLGSGGHFASFSGNTMFWQVRLEPADEPDDEPGGGDRTGDRTTMVCHKYRAHLDDPAVTDGRQAEMTGMWADPLVGRPEWSVLGAGSAFGLYHRFGRATAQGVGGFVVYRPDHWLVDGTGLGYGDVLGAHRGVVGYEVVGCPLTFDDLQQPVAARREHLPDDIVVVAFTPSSNLAVGEYPSSIAALSDQGDLEFIADRVYGGTGPEQLARARHGNAVMLTCRPMGAAGGEVVTVGSTDWVFGLPDDAAVAQVTANVLDRFAVGRARP